MSKRLISLILKSPSRRQFLRTSVLAGAAGALAQRASMARSFTVAGSDLLRIGLIGCGGRGTGAAAEALAADKNVKLVAMGDASKDRLESSLAELRNDQTIATKIDVANDRCFVGFDAYKEVIASGVEVVLLAAPPHFRPSHL